jgi:hypothetical protein
MILIFLASISHILMINKSKTSLQDQLSVELHACMGQVKYETTKETQTKFYKVVAFPVGYMGAKLGR